MEFDELVNRYMEDMYAMAVRLTGSPHAAEDLVHDLFMQLKVKDMKTDHVINHRAWLGSILYRSFVDWWRREKRSPVKWFSDLSDMQAIEDTEAKEPTPCQQVEAMEQSEKVWYALNRLKEDHRRILILHDMEGYALNELQHMLKLPLGTIKSRLHRAREKMQQELNRNGLGFEDRPQSVEANS